MSLEALQLPMLEIPAVQVALSVIYAQVGLLLLGYLFYRRLRELRGSVAAEQAGRTSMTRNFERTIARLEERLEQFESEAAVRRGKRAARRVSGLRRKRAMALLAEGRDAVEAAASAGLRLAEVRLLSKLRSNGEENAAAVRAP